ncbi:Nn.00g085230.m01.CDS01 [Neocucurbitaria sp. VM-36]
MAMPLADSTRTSKRLLIFCDGTWVGRETNVANAPTSNIRQLANLVGDVQYSKDAVQEPSKVHIIKPHLTTAMHYSPYASGVNGSDTSDIIAGYQEGVGVGGTFLEYIWDGATASTIGDECVSVYKFIVEHYTSDAEIWLFGFSRGAFTVRCVAGMINNCGIIKRLPEYTDGDVNRLCYEVFRTYRSDLPTDAPKSEPCRRWRRDSERVWQVQRPIRFMGCIDTVGALGIPRLNAGIGFDWSAFEFFDQHASSVIQYVYHAPALHDRLWIFQPCLIYPNDDDGKGKPVVKQQWFPGTHYDLGRMTFRFVRQSPGNWIEGLLGWLPDLLSRTIYPNEVLSDCVLRWLLESIQEVDSNSHRPIIADTKGHIQRITERMANAEVKTTGSGDIYGDVLNYTPAGIVWGSIQRASRFFFSLLDHVLPRLGSNIQDLLGIKTILGILTATADRRIPGVAAEVYPYIEQESVGVKGQERVFSVQEQARMRGQNEWGKERYVSRTFEAFLLWRRVFGTKTGA